LTKDEKFTFEENTQSVSNPIASEVLAC